MSKFDRIQFRKSSSSLLAGACLIALTIGAAATDANAQSFQGTPTIEAGGVSFSTGPNTTEISISTPTAVINWQPNDTSGTGEILFQAQNTTATFRSTGSVVVDFAVLNRILPIDDASNPVNNRPVRFDGNVVSVAGSAVTQRAGSIWFYTPGGIILGSTSTFDVGSLLLSTSAIANADLFVGNSGSINFTGAITPNSSIVVENGAQVTALNELSTSSYLAMFAPSVVQSGTVDVDGSVGYIGGEQGQLQISNGLFGISIKTGTDDANGVVHTGTTTGDASTPVAGNPDARAIYMVAVPKNNAITMLLGGTAGYRAASTAIISNGEVVLSAGHNVAVGGTAAFPQVTVDPSPANGITADINFTGGSFTSDTGATASGSINAEMPAAANVLVGTGATGYRYNLTLNAGQQIDIGAGNGGAVRVDGSANLTAADIGFNFQDSGQFVVGGGTNLTASQSIMVNHSNNSGVFSIILPDQFMPMRGVIL